MSSSNTYKLYYFDGRGRAEPIRLILTLAGLKFEDVRFTFEEWPKMKSEMPLGQMPVLELNGTKYPQSVALARYVARQVKIAGKDDLEAMKCDIIVDSMQDIINEYYRIWFHTEDEKVKEAEQNTFKTKTIPDKMGGLEKLMNMYGNGVWTVGDHATWADLVVHDVVETVLTVDDQVLNKYHKVKKNREAVEKLPNIAHYLANRKKTDF